MGKGLVAVVLAACLITSEAYAACDISVKDSKVTLNLSGFRGCNDVMVRVVRSGFDFSDLADCADMTEVIAYQNQVETDRAGTAELSFFLDRTDSYMLEVGERGAADTEQYTFEYTDINYAGDFIADVNTAVSGKDAAALRNLIELNYKKLSLAASVFEKLTEEAALANAYKMLANSGSFADLAGLEKAMNTCALFVLCRQQGAQNAGKLIAEYAIHTELGDTGAYQVYDRYLSPETKKELIEQFIKTEYASSEEALDQFCILAVTMGIRNALGAETVKGILTACSKEIGIDLALCGRLKNPMNVYQALCGADTAGLQDVAKRFQDAYEKQKDAETYKPSPGGNRGGGGGSGSGTALLTPAENKPAPETEAPEEIFTDLGRAEWAKASVLRLYEKGIVAGKEAGLFAPEDVVTREEFIKLVVLAAGVYDESARCAFQDVEEDSWYYPYVASGVNRGLIQGMDDGSFGVGRIITREDMAVIICRAVGIDEATGFEGTIMDREDIAQYALSAVEAMYQNGIVSGTPDGRFLPKKGATRAEAAVIIDRMLQFGGGGSVN